MDQQPVVVLVPGLWEGPMVFSLVRPRLVAYGFDIVEAPLLSTGTESPGNPSLLDDVQGIRRHIEPLVKQDKAVVVVGHSAGAFLAAAATKGLSAKERAAEGKTGGVTKFVFVAGGLWPEGFEHGPLPFMDVQGNAMYCKDPKTLLFNDMPAAEADKWLSQAKCQPAHGWDAKIEWAGWKDVPSVFLSGTKDAILPEPLCRQMAEMAGSQFVTCDAGHMSPLSQPDAVADIIKKSTEL